MISDRRTSGFRRWIKAAGMLVVLSCGTIVAGPAGGADKEKPPFPLVQIPGFAHREQAIQALADKLPAVAAWYGKSAAELASLFRHDQTLWVSPAGRLLYVCELEAPVPEPAESQAGAIVVPPTSYPLGQTFYLHSSPGSNRVIYLDFNGQVVSGTAWGSNIVAAPFSIDSDPAFNSTELLIIQNVWKRVAEDYSMFDVDVTTEEPAADALTRTSSGDNSFGNRVVITPTNFYPNAGGVSYVGVFDYVGEYYKTSWVFSNMLANNEKYIAEACSHENGHSVGLSHDGKTDGTVYYAGQGNWAPIMGNSYYKAVTQWCKGEYAGANNTEDQLQVVQGNGLSYYVDDHGNTAATASVLSGTTSIGGSGFIERNTDVDVFKLVSGAGAISVSVDAAPVGPNLDILAELRDGGFNLIASSNPPELGAGLSATVAAGTYYLVIRGTGAGDPLTNGYSNYGSLGQYTFTGTIVNPGSMTPPVAIASATPTSGYAPLSVAFSSSGSADPGGGIVSYLWNFGDGAGSTLPNPDHTYSVAGTYTATLTVTDNDGMTGSASVGLSVLAAPVPPTVSITSPASGSTVSGTVSVLVSASSNAGIDSVSLAIDGTSVGTDTASPYTFSWNTTTSANGLHSLVATARDKNGSSSTTITVTVSNLTDTTPPTINITSPAGGSNVSGNVTVTVVATDNVKVVKVELYVDGKLKATSTTAPFTTKWNTNGKVAKGPHTLQCFAYDAAGNKGASQIVTVNKP